MASTSVRISKRTHERLKALAEQEHRSLGEMLDAAMSQYQGSPVLARYPGGIRRLREDPGEAWQAYKESWRNGMRR